MEMIFVRDSKKVLPSGDIFLENEAWGCLISQRGVVASTGGGFLSVPYVNGGKLFHRSKYKGPCTP